MWGAEQEIVTTRARVRRLEEDPGKKREALLARRGRRNSITIRKGEKVL